MENAWANVFIQDGSVDLSQVDNYFHCARSVLADGTVKYYFISFEEKKLYGADGQKDCFERSIKSLYHS